jgi:hypothetical protein
MTNALRYNAGKPRLSHVLTAPKALEGLARIFEYGAQKYAPHNWKKGLPTDEVVDSLMRHLLAFQNSEKLDAESGLPHIDHVLWNALVLSEQAKSDATRKGDYIDSCIMRKDSI